MSDTQAFVDMLSRKGVELVEEGASLRCKAPAGVLTPELRRELAARKAALLAHLATAQERSRVDWAPLSFFQRQLWVVHRLYPDSCLLNSPRTIRMGEAVDGECLSRSLTEFVRRHEITRTAFVLREGEVMQHVLPARPFDLPIMDLRAEPEELRETEAERAAMQDLKQPLDLTCGQTFRARLVILSDSDYRLYVVFSDLAFDIWSADVLFPCELERTYSTFVSGGATAPNRAARQHREFVRWQRDQFTQARLAPQIAYWKTALAGVSAAPLPKRSSPNRDGNLVGARHPLRLDRSLTTALHQLSRRTGCTQFMVLVAAIKILLYRHSGQADIAIGTMMLDRNAPEFADTVGPIEKTLVLRTDLGGNPPVQELLTRVRSTCVQAYAHQEVPFDQLVAALEPERVPSSNPLFQVMFNLVAAQAASERKWSVSGFDLYKQLAQFDLHFWLYEEGDEIGGWIEYRTALFDPEVIARMAGHLGVILERMAADTEEGIAEMPVLTPAEINRQVYEWNDTTAPYRRDATMQLLFEEQAEQTPEAIAVDFEGEQLTYLELERRANQLARHLVALGVHAGDRVGLCIERSVELVVGVLGILKAGAAYVPLDPAYPQARRAFMLTEAEVRIVLTLDHLQPRLSDHRGVVLCLDTEWAAVAHHDASRPGIRVEAQALAYVIYTSGSTGRPKGVMISHRSAVNTLMDINRRFAITRRDRVLALSSLSFDLSVYDIFGTLAAGATIVMPRPSCYPDPAYWRALMDRAGVTVWNSAPPLMEVLIHYLENVGDADAGRLPECLRLAMLSGDWISVALPDRIRARGGDIQIWSLGGATEAAIWSICYRIGEVGPEWKSIPYGRPMANQQFYVLDAFARPVPVGAVGELYIGGEGVAQGYLNCPELNAERFIADPFRPDANTKLYRTGDLGRYLPDGNIEFLGRIDSQVKIRGFRVELGEIETALAQHPDVRETVVLTRGDQAGKQLAAYVVPRDATVLGPDCAGVYAKRMRRHLQDRLPDYMVPSSVHFLAAFPMTPNGKLDRNALLALQTDDTSHVQDIPMDALSVEQKLASVWRRMLGIPAVGVDDNFFDLGGHSLLAIAVADAVQREHGFELPPAFVFRHPTIRSLAQSLRQMAAVTA